MRSLGTWVFVFFLIAAFLVALALDFAFKDLFLLLNVDNFAILGANFRLSTLAAAGSSLVLAIFCGFVYKAPRNYIEQCIVEFNKVAWPMWSETKVATFTVVVVAVIASVILGLMDTFFGWWTSNNLFIW
jgi:preprotein translocase SecE subunit